MNPDPSTWTPRQRASAAGALLRDLIEEVPTARTTWSEKAEVVAERERRAEQTAAAIDAIYKAAPRWSWQGSQP